MLSDSPPTVSHLAVHGYRSLQQLMVPLAPITVVFWANGCGKSNLYRSLSLIVVAVRGDLLGGLARLIALSTQSFQGWVIAHDEVQIR
jgi:predicted ATPase